MTKAEEHNDAPMTQEALAALGLESVAYLREVDGANGPNVAIHVADGRQVAIAPTAEKAMAIILSNDLRAVSRH